MKKFLLPENGNFYKANLHCHSTVSDGEHTPERLKEMYKGKGYSVIAYTDHHAMVDHSDLTDEGFLALVGVELDSTENKTFSEAKCCHMCFIAPEPSANMPCYHRTKYFWNNTENYRNAVRYDKSKPDFEREYTPENISLMMKEGQDNGFFVTYNHPSWSLESYNDYTNYHNMDAMEICNYGCFVCGYNDYNEKEYDDMLRAGKRIYCISTDDNHNHGNDSDSFGGFTVIKAEGLEYGKIFKALKAGDFYASQGPEIFELYVEDGKIHVKCSPEKSIIMNTGRRRTAWAISEGGVPVTEGHFEFAPEDKYIRITVTDFEGKHANTNAYFVDEL